MQLEWVAGPNHKGFTDAIRWVRKRDLFASRRRDVHAGSNDIEPARFEAGNQRAKFRQHAARLTNSQSLQHHSRNFRSFAR